MFGNRRGEREGAQTAEWACVQDKERTCQNIRTHPQGHIVILVRPCDMFWCSGQEIWKETCPSTRTRPFGHVLVFETKGEERGRGGRVRDEGGGKGRVFHVWLVRAWVTCWRQGGT